LGEIEYGFEHQIGSVSLGTAAGIGGDEVRQRELVNAAIEELGGGEIVTQFLL